MAKGDKKRTYKVTEKGVRIIDHMEENTILDKSDFVDRAVKYYWVQLQNGNLNDPVLTDSSGDGIGELDLDTDDGGSSSLMDRLRGKK